MSIGGVFGVMNTMFAAISQRIKDIGVMRLIGFSSGQILLSFVIESLGIAVIGGLLGCLLGSLCDGWSVTSVITSGMGAGKTVAFKLAIDAPSLARGMLLTLLMGLIGGLLPALNAMRLRALEALR
jgi:ABC-type antimicrobial peptide transport system permease subunit